MKITGIILAGGKSKRMGTEKGLVLFRGKSLIEYPYELFNKLCDEVIISSNSNSFNYLGCSVYKDEDKDFGPIGGIYTCLKTSSNEINIISPCDMPFLTIELYQLLLSNLSNFDAVLTTKDGFHIEPLVGIYNKSTLPLFKKYIESGNSHLQELIKELNYNLIKIDSFSCNSDESLFLNINTLSELNFFSKK